MYPTAIGIVISLTLLGMSYCVSVVVLRLGAYWARIEGVTYQRSLVATLVAFVAQFLFIILALCLPLSNIVRFLAIVVLGPVFAVLVPSLAIMHFLKARFFRALQAWSLVAFVCTGIIGSLALPLVFVFFKSYMISSNSMAPTLLGRHWEAPCPICGTTAYCSPLDDRQYYFSQAPFMICENFHTSQTAPLSKRLHLSDRVLVNKSVELHRWDMIVFRYPEEPTESYVFRLVGLPGEQVFIKDGLPWVDGEQLSPPESLGSITYKTQLDGVYEIWGTEDRPAELGVGEYFVLGDFSTQAKDSRLWQDGILGHPPYSVPLSHIQGVVTHIYWPPSRWRSFR